MTFEYYEIHATEWEAAQAFWAEEEDLAQMDADWEASGLTNALPFAQKVNQCGKVLSLEDNNTSLG